QAKLTAANAKLVRIAAIHGHRLKNAYETSPARNPASNANLELNPLGRDPSARKAEQMAFPRAPDSTSDPPHHPATILQSENKTEARTTTAGSFPIPRDRPRPRANSTL